jgi:acetylornithine/succinyldiaminopimelate/putrescine aminotransferase
MRAAAERGAELRAGLEALAREQPRVAGLSGRGLIQGVRIGWGAEELQKELYQAGLIVNRTGGDVLRLLPPFVVTSAQIQRALAILREVLARRVSPAGSHPVGVLNS